MLFLFAIHHSLLAQTIILEKPANTDSTTKIDILRAKSLRQITLSNGVILETLAGNAAVRQGNTILEGDSIILDKSSGIAEVFGHVHISDADTINTYADYLKYIGNTQIAYLTKNVKLTDGKSQITTNNLEYDVKTGIATYKDGGKVVNGSTVLTSNEAIYFSDTKDVFFKKNVHLKDHKNDMVADSLRYNTAFKNAYFISPTHIQSGNGTIDTKSGTYNLETGEAVFYDRTIIKDSSRFIIGNQVAFDEKNNIIQIEGNGKLVDSSNNVIVLGDQMIIDKKNSTFLATRKPVMIIFKNNDSTFITADTLYSGKRKNQVDSSVSITKTDAVKNSDSVKYFMGFHHVRIYNDSIQAVADSLHYSTIDSTFKLFKNPVCWNGNTQLSGDTIFLFTTNQQPKRVFIWNNAMVINKTSAGFYNQMTGRNMNAYFNDGNLDYIRTKGSPAESIFYPQDEDSAYIGMNRNKGDVIDMTFSNKAMNKIKFINAVKGTLYPMNQIPVDLKYFNNFKWQESIRPKNKFVIFE